MLDLMDEGAGGLNATQLAEAQEALGASITTGATMDSSVIQLSALTPNLQPSVALLADVVRNPIYSTGVGLLLYGLQKQSDGISMSGSSFSSDEPKTPVLEKLKRWVQGNF